MTEKLQFRFYFALEVDVWLELYLKIYYKSSITFVCERFENFLIFINNFIFICDFSLIQTYGILGVRSKEIWMTEKLQFRFYFALEVDVWVELFLKIYCKSSISFVCERFEKFLIFINNFIFICDSSSVQMHGVLHVRSKRAGMSENKCSLVCIWSQRSIFGLNCILRYIVSHPYHLSVSDLKSF